MPSYFYQNEQTAFAISRRTENILNNKKKTNYNPWTQICQKQIFNEKLKKVNIRKYQKLCCKLCIQDKKKITKYTVVKAKE